MNFKILGTTNYANCTNEMNQIVMIHSLYRRYPIFRKHTACGGYLF